MMSTMEEMLRIMMTIQMIRKLQGISMNTRQSITLFHTVINMREGGAMSFIILYSFSRYFHLVLPDVIHFL